MATHTVHTTSLCQGKACGDSARALIASRSSLLAPIIDSGELPVDRYGVTPIHVRAEKRLEVLRARFDKQLAEYSFAQMAYTDAVLNNASKSVRDEFKKQITYFNSQLLETAEEIHANMETLAGLDKRMDAATSQQRQLFKRKIAELTKAKHAKPPQPQSFEGEYEDSVLRVESVRYKYILWLVATLIIVFITIQHVRN
jgi:hypothetical protein